jgi:hypothetical protein
MSPEFAKYVFWIHLSLRLGSKISRLRR